MKAILTAIRDNGITLAIFACACTGLVATIHYLTQDRILLQEQERLKLTLNQVIPNELYDNELYTSCILLREKQLGTTEPMLAYIAKKNNQPVAIAIEAVAPDGYNGKIKMIVGIDYAGKIIATRVLSHNETPGLGDKIDIRVTDWVYTFNGKQVTPDNLNRWKVKKDGGQFDQFTGATITPRAVVKAVKNTVIFYNESRDRLYSQPLDCREYP